MRRPARWPGDRVSRPGAGNACGFVRQAEIIGDLRDKIQPSGTFALIVINNGRFALARKRTLELE